MLVNPWLVSKMVGLWETVHSRGLMNRRFGTPDLRAVLQNTRLSNSDPGADRE